MFPRIEDPDPSSAPSVSAWAQRTSRRRNFAVNTLNVFYGRNSVPRTRSRHPSWECHHPPAGWLHPKSFPKAERSRPQIVPEEAVKMQTGHDSDRRKCRLPHPARHRSRRPNLLTTSGRRSSSLQGPGVCGTAAFRPVAVQPSSAAPIGPGRKPRGGGVEDGPLSQS